MKLAFVVLFAGMAQPSFGQVLTNGSFESPSTASSAVPPNWFNCGGSPDVQIINGSGAGIFGINTPPSNGNTYMGMVTTNNQNYQEAMGQPVTLVAGTNYTGAIDLYYSNIHSSWNGNGRLHIWGGSSCGARNELLFDSGTISNLASWNTFPISFTPIQNHSYIILVNYMNNGTGSMNYLCMDNFSLTNILPIELANFSGEGSGEGVQLNWETGASLSGQSFELTWSDDPDPSQPFESIDAQEASAGQRDFGYLHRSASPGDNFYRLKMTDENGSVSFSEVLKVEFQSAHVTEVFPNPSNGRLQVTAHFYEAGTAQIEVLDLQGRRVFDMSDSRDKGMQRFELDLNGHAAPGIYNLRIQLDGRTEFHKIAIQ